MLHAVNTKHSGQLIRSSFFFGFWVEKVQSQLQADPTTSIHLSEKGKNYFTCFTTLVVEFAVGKSELM